MEFIWNLRPNSWKQAYPQSWQNNLLTVPFRICSPCETVHAGNGHGVQNLVSDHSCEHDCHAPHTLTRKERHVSLNLNFHVSYYLSFLHQFFSACSIVLSSCSVQGRHVLSVDSGHALPQLDNCAFQNATTSQQCRATGFKAIPMISIESPGDLLLQINCSITHKKKTQKLYLNSVLKLH